MKRAKFHYIRLFYVVSGYHIHSLFRGTPMMHNAQMDFLPLAEMVKVL